MKELILNTNLLYTFNWKGLKSKQPFLSYPYVTLILLPTPPLLACLTMGYVCVND